LIWRGKHFINAIEVVDAVGIIIHYAQNEIEVKSIGA